MEDGYEIATIVLICIVCLAVLWVILLQLDVNKLNVKIAELSRFREYAQTRLFDLEVQMKQQAKIA